MRGGGDGLETTNRAALDVEKAQVRMWAMSALQSPRVVEGVLPSAQKRHDCESLPTCAGFATHFRMETDEALRMGQDMIITCRCGQTRYVADCPCGFDAFLDAEFRKIQERYPIANERTTRPDPSPVASLQKPK